MDASVPGDNNAQAVAEACAKAMWLDDHASKGLGMSLQLVAPGEAVLTMTVRKDMTNGHGICHGGFIFTLADSTFAFACNTYDQRTVAQQCAVTFLQPVREGETLTAHAVERNRAGRAASMTLRSATAATRSSRSFADIRERFRAACWKPTAINKTTSRMGGNVDSDSVA